MWWRWLGGDVPACIGLVCRTVRHRCVFLCLPVVLLLVWCCGLLSSEREDGVEVPARRAFLY